MVQRDFFAFCKSLQLIELKAIGSLSPVKHFAENEIVYSAGEEGRELFIVTRGAVELLPPNARAGAATTVLSRGDIFGETGALMELPRNNTARACGCTQRAMFPPKRFSGTDTASTVFLSLPFGEIGQSPLPGPRTDPFA